MPLNDVPWATLALLGIFAVCLWALIHGWGAVSLAL